MRGTESSRGLQPPIFHVDGDDPRCTGQYGAAHGVDSHASDSDDHHTVTGSHIGGVQDRTSPGQHPAAKKRCLGERRFLGDGDELVLVD